MQTEEVKLQQCREKAEQTRQQRGAGAELSKGAKQGMRRDTNLADSVTEYKTRWAQ